MKLVMLGCACFWAGIFLTPAQSELTLRELRSLQEQVTGARDKYLHAADELDRARLRYKFGPELDV